MGQLGKMNKRGFLNQSNKIVPGAWVVIFTTDILPREQEYEVYHGSIRGPGGYFVVYVDDEQYSVGQNGLISAYDPNNAMSVLKGQQISFHWSIATGTFPMVWLRFRQPPVE